MNSLQVDKKHYYNFNYNHKARWLTYHYQLSFLNKYEGKDVLEIGPGHGWMRDVAKDLGINIKTVDFDPELKPDYVASIEKLPIDDDSFDIVCAFEVLEHLPYEKLETNLKEMLRVAKKYVIISVPDHRHTLLRLNLKIPLCKEITIFRRRETNIEHVFDGQHYWEIGKKQYPLSRVLKDLKQSDFNLVEHAVFHDVPTNHYFVFKKHTS